MKINQILDKIEGYQLFVPAFQREFVWKREDFAPSSALTAASGTSLLFYTFREERDSFAFELGSAARATKGR